MRTANLEPIIVAAKRGPVEYRYASDGSVVSSVSPEGTASVIADQAGFLGVTWLASAMTDAERRLAAEKPGGRKVDIGDGTMIRLRLLVHDPAVFDPVQYYFANEVLWLSQHSLHNRWLEPDYTARTQRAWDAFVAFNHDYAKAMLETASAVGASTFLVYDFQLMYAPRLLRREWPHARILSFSHSAWPGPNEWRVVPRYIRTPLIEAVLGADVLGFFAGRWVTNFLRCVSDMLPGATVDWNRRLVIWDGHTTAVRAMPLGYSPQTLANRAITMPEELAQWLGERTLVVHSGRSDPIKNASRAITVFVDAVEKFGMAESCRFVVKMNPSRLYVSVNQEYVDETRRRVEQANERLGTRAIRLIIDNDVSLTLGLLRRADVLFLNSVIDGMNLTAFEGVMVSERNCALILSENCGAAEVLGAVTTTVNPFDLVEQNAALSKALVSGGAERKASYGRLRNRVLGYTLRRWVESQTASLAEDFDGA